MLAKQGQRDAPPADSSAYQEVPRVVQAVDRTPAPTTVRMVNLPGRGRLLVWEAAGPQGAPALILLHGVAMTAELGWSQVIDHLGEKYRVIAPDLRGHGDGIRCRGHFRLEDCADDVAALAGVLGLERVVAVGYSMGGILAQVLWKRHRSLVGGLVLAATARNVRGSPVERLLSLTLPAITSTMRWHPAAHLLTSASVGMSALGYIEDPTRRAWARRQLDRTTLSNAMSAVQAVSTFSSHEWIGQVDVPVTSIVTTRDRLVAPSRQLRLASAIPHATVLELAADHGVCVNDPVLFGKAISAACAAVLSRQAPGERAGGKIALALAPSAVPGAPQGDKR